MVVVKGSAPTNRRVRAKQTRTRILDVAYRLLCAEGYEATTMQRIADEAGVAVQTVYLTFGTKGGLVEAVEDRAVLGDGHPSDWRQEKWAGELATATDPRQVLAVFVKVDTEIKARLSPLIAALGPMLAPDPETLAARERGQDEFFGFVIDCLVQLGSLRPGLTRSKALDILRVLNTPGAFTDLTTRRGWTKAQWRHWLTDLLASQLLA